MFRRFLRWLVNRRPSANGDEEDGSVWNATPEWQYAGLHVESGGLTRDEQERSLAEIQQQADAERQVDPETR